VSDFRTPDTLQDALHTARMDLDTLGKDLNDAHTELDDAQDEWEKVYDAVVDGLEDEVAEGKRSLPGEEVRRSIARRSDGGWRAWSRFRRAENEVKRIDKQIARIDKQIRAAQSELKQMQAEAGVAP
jgi:peptidoglycan hydrolase CwlO-like protein